MYHRTLPADVREVSKGLNVVGAIEVECSPLIEDNQWVLDVSAKDPFIVGTVGHLEPGNAEFRKQLDRFRKNPLFRGIRYAYLWGNNLGEELKKPEFVAGLKMLADAGLSLDTANPTTQMLADVANITDKVPNLRIIIDHLAGMVVAPDAPDRAEYTRLMKTLGGRKQVYVKVSNVLKKIDGKVNYDVNAYRGKIDELWDTFGADRLLYGSDWPNSEPLGKYPQVLQVVRDYFQGKGREAEEKYFYKNSQAAYRWVKRG